MVFIILIALIFLFILFRSKEKDLSLIYTQNAFLLLATSLPVMILILVS